MKSQNSFSIYLVLLHFIFQTNILAQEVDITSYLKKIEAGEKGEVANSLASLKQKHPNSSAVLYLEALLTENGEIAYQKYNSIVERYPDSKYADDALYRIFAYFYAIDDLNKAEFFRSRLKSEYPESPYIKLTDKTTFSDYSVPIVKQIEQKSAPKVVEKQAAGNFQYTIQAGAFSRKDNAVRLKEDLDKAGYNTQLIEKSVGGTVFHVVYVGKFSSDEEAKNYLSIINPKFKIQGWVVKIN
ncbi:MAG: SPOR domain-containing protein [Ignavibacteriaceae bacterium]|nr:SPOR domain-containing protein [Ignavibacteriaceae bacterium]